jgi:hypothetical protein
MPSPFRPPACAVGRGRWRLQLKVGSRFCNGQICGRANSRGIGAARELRLSGSVPKQPIKLSPRHSGRRVRWTFEVSADVDAEKRPRVKTPAKRRQPAKSTAKKASPPSRSKRQQANDAVPPATTRTAVPATAPVIHEQAVVESPSIRATAPATQPTPPWQPTRGQMVTLAGVAVLVIAAVAMPQPAPSDPASSQQPPERREFSTVVAPGPSPTTIARAPRAAAVTARGVGKTQALTERSEKPSTANVTNRTAQPAKPASPASPTATTANAFAASDSTMKPAAPEPMAASPASASAVSPPSAVTVTGCLEISTDGNEFRLADTEGADAPKARSWRTGFLGKRTAPVALVGTPDPLALKSSIGKRVAVTGVLTSRELHVSSLRVVRSSCN